MRPIHLARMDKVRLALVLTRESVRPHLRRVTVAPITSTIRGLSTEIPVGTVNGLAHDSVINVDNIATIDTADLLEHVGFLLDHQERSLTLAIHAAYRLQE